MKRLRVFCPAGPKVFSHAKIHAEGDIRDADSFTADLRLFRGDGTPVAVLEASATGLPVVATRHAGIPDVVLDGETGLLVDEGDVEGMAAQMIRLADDPELAARLGRAGRQRVCAEFSMEKSIAGLWSIIEGAIHNAAR